MTKRLIDFTDDELRAHLSEQMPRGSDGQCCRFLVMLIREEDDSLALVTNMDNRCARETMMAVAVRMSRANE